MAPEVPIANFRLPIADFGSALPASTFVTLQLFNENCRSLTSDALSAFPLAMNVARSLKGWYFLQMAATEIPHLKWDPSGSVWIDDTGFRVIDLVREHLAHGWGADALQENHPDLTLAQIHAALAWFYDHEEEVMREIAKRENRADQIFSDIGSHSVAARLRSIKLSRCG